MKQTIVVRTDLGMGTGKLAAQVAHASLRAADASDEGVRTRWDRDGATKVVLEATSEDQLRTLADRARRAGLPTELVSDAGRTQLSPGTVTALAVGPGPEEEVDHLTGHLSLL